MAALFYCTLEMETSASIGVGTNFGEDVWSTYFYLPWNYDIPLEDKAELIEQFLHGEKATKEQKLIMLAIHY